MRHLLTISCLGLLSACNQSAPGPVDRADQGGLETSPPKQNDELLPVDTLAGEWRVAGIDGEALDETYGLALSADAEKIWMEPRCAGMIGSSTIDGNSFALGPQTSAVPASTSTPAPVCAVAMPPRLRDVRRALQHADRVVLTSSNGIEISGGGHSITLFSQ